MMEEFEKDIQRLERRIIKKINAKNITAFYGSSTIRLWVTMQEDLPFLNTINLGFGGSHFDACIHYFDRLFKKLTPWQIVLYAGDNDLSQGYDANEIHARFLTLTNRIRKRFPDIYFHCISIKPSPHREDKMDIIREANQMIQRSIKVLGNAQLIDVFSPLLSEKEETRPELFLADGLHLNKKGYKIWGGAVAEAMKPFSSL